MTTVPLRSLQFLLCVLLLAAPPAWGLVRYEKGRIEIDGILLLQDYDDPDVYYYVPPTPRISTREDGSLELSCVKFVDPEGDVDGGMLHLLVEFSLPPEQVEALRKKLEKRVPGAELRGPVALVGATDEEEDPTSFKVISAVLSDTAEGGFTKSVITSGRAPLTPGSKAAVAAILDKHGATLLWESLERPTSDISVSLRAYYEAALPGYKARIFADIATIYKHFSSIRNRQEGYTKREIRRIVDEMRRKGLIEIEVFDRSVSAGKSGMMEGLVNLATDKLITMIFDTTTGLSKLPEKEKAVEKGQIARRQQRGWFARLFAGSGNQPYVTDDQYVLKDRADIKSAVFSINLTKNATIRVPVDSSGNMSGIYRAYRDDPDVFRVVNLKDPAFQKREIFFKVDGEFSGAFDKIVNFAAVSFRKVYRGRPDFTAELVFTQQDVKGGEVIKAVTYPRLGATGSDWLEYEYSVSWSVHGRDALRIPAEQGAWIRARGPIVTLTPPLERVEVEIDADRASFGARGVKSAVVEFRYPLFGRRKQERKAVLRESDAEQSKVVAFYADRGRTPEVRVTWYAKSGGPRRSTGWRPLDETYFYLDPPQMERAGGGSLL